MNKPASLPRPLELVSFGDSVGVVLPGEFLAELGLSVGDHVRVAVERDGGSLDAQMAAAREVMSRRRKALAELAK